MQINLMGKESEFTQKIILMNDPNRNLVSDRISFFIEFDLHSSYVNSSDCNRDFRKMTDGFTDQEVILIEFNEWLRTKKIWEKNDARFNHRKWNTIHLLWNQWRLIEFTVQCNVIFSLH